jgi:hypothetical protein
MILINIKASNFLNILDSAYLTNLSFMDFLFYVPILCTAAAAVTEI